MSYELEQEWPLKVLSEISTPPKGEYDLFVSALGYESRCVNVLSQLSGAPRQSLVIGFPTAQVLAFASNKRQFQDRGLELEFLDDTDIPVRVRDVLGGLDHRERLHIGLDVSSFSRSRTAAILTEVGEFARERDVTFDILYSPARYVEPKEPVAPLATLEPVVPALRGAAADPEFPAVAIIGVGYEEQRGLGVLEFLEATEAWLLLPEGFDPAFDGDVKRANGQLIERMGERILRYDPSTPLLTYRSIQSLAHGLRRSWRIVMVPMGPKILATCCALVGLQSQGRDAVWRASSGELEAPKDVEAAGEIVGLRFSSAIATNSTGDGD